MHTERGGGGGFATNFGPLGGPLTISTLNLNEAEVHTLCTHSAAAAAPPTHYLHVTKANQIQLAGNTQCYLTAGLAGVQGKGTNRTSKDSVPTVAVLVPLWTAGRGNHWGLIEQSLESGLSLVAAADGHHKKCPLPCPQFSNQKSITQLPSCWTLLQLNFDS